jgi:hypothetical protein
MQKEHLEEVIKQNQLLDDHGPMILGIREKPLSYYFKKPKYPSKYRWLKIREKNKK